MSALVDVAADFSPRFERHRDGLVSIDIGGLERLFLRRSVLDRPEPNGARTLASGGGASRSVWKAIGEELRRDAAARGLRVQVAIAATRTAALVLACARPGLTVVERGEEAGVLAPISIDILECLAEVDAEADRVGAELAPPKPTAISARPSKLGPYTSVVSVFKTWGVKTLGELAALPSADLAARLGPRGLAWQALARGDDVRPLVPTLPLERFDASLDLEWPIEGLEPLSFVLTRLLEPLSTRLERRDRGAAVLHVQLRLVSKEIHARSLQLPSPMRDVRTLRTLALLDLESHPPAAAIDRVTVIIDPTPGRVLQHMLFTRAHPTPEQLSTLVGRLGALLGQDRIGTAATVDSDRPGAFEMRPFATEHAGRPGGSGGSGEPGREEILLSSSACGLASEASGPARGGGAPRGLQNVVSALRRCREPVPARVTVTNGRPVRVTTDRRGFVGGMVVQAAGPWRTSGEWWAGGAGGAGRERQETRQTIPPVQPFPPIQPKGWHRDEWDVALSDGAVYRIFQDRETDRWFIDAIVD